MYIFCIVESSFLPSHREGNMQKGSFVLSLFLLLSGRPACYGSTVPMADEESSGSAASTVGGTPAPSTVLLTNSDQVMTTATVLTDNEISATTKINGTSEMETEDLNLVLLYGVPAGLLVLLILLVFVIVRCHKQKKSKPGHELDLGVPHEANLPPLLPDQASNELGSENCKSPIFEEDTPSVMEIEMEELDKWMNSLKRNVECEYLPPVKEEKDLNTNLSDCES